MYAAWIGRIFILSRNEPSRCTYVQSNCTEKAHTQRCVDDDQRPQHSPKSDGSEPLKEIRKSNRQNSVDLGQLVRPSIISNVDTSKKGISSNVMALIPPISLLRNRGITRCVNALQNNVVGLFVGGCGCGCVGNCWWVFVGPQNPIPKTLNQITRFRFPGISPTSITYAEGYAP